MKGLIDKRFFIESFYVPYRCDSCSNEKKISLVESKDFKMSTGHENGEYNIKKFFDCDKCDDEMELDVFEEVYFSFLKRPLS